jgi:large subunit ribosomal protein L25
MDNVNIAVQKRDVTGTRASKRMRKAGLIPGVLYGHGKDAVLIAVEPHALREALNTGAGTHAVLNVTFEGQKRGHKAIVKEMTLDSVKNNVIHIDLQEIRLDETIETTVAVHFEGESAGVKAGGMLEEATREVTIRGVVTEIPEHLVMDISHLEIGDTAKVADLQVPEGIEVQDDPDAVLCSVLAPRKAVEGEEVEEGVEVETGAAEPELVGKKEEEPEA